MNLAMNNSKQLIAPFAGWRPTESLVSAIAAPPYDVLSRGEAQALAALSPYSFLHVSRAEVDLDPQCPAEDPLVYATAREKWRTWCQQGIFVQETSPCFYLYRLQMEEKSYVGLVAAASVADYLQGRIRKHEVTRPDKEKDRTELASALSANSGPVFLVYRRVPGLEEILQSVINTPPVYDFITADEIQHTFWVIKHPLQIATITEIFDGMTALYIADGHHRSAAAARVCQQRGDADGRFLCVLFSDHQVRILEYNRMVRDLQGLTVDQFLAQLAERFVVIPECSPVRPLVAYEFGMYCANQWYRLVLRQEQYVFDTADPVTRLGVYLLDQHLLQPILGIHDPRRDVRIEFVGGRRGLKELEQRVHSGEMAVAFSLYPTQLADLLAVADAGTIMPPKSTWFEPKLRDGLIVQEI